MGKVRFTYSPLYSGAYEAVFEFSGNYDTEDIKRELAIWLISQTDAHYEVLNEDK